eukprot:874791-Prymnesium_polylepis.1
MRAARRRAAGRSEASQGPSPHPTRAPPRIRMVRVANGQKNGGLTRLVPRTTSVKACGVGIKKRVEEAHRWLSDAKTRLVQQRHDAREDWRGGRSAAKLGHV